MTIDALATVTKDIEDFGSNVVSHTWDGLRTVVDDVEGLLGGAINDMGDWPEHLENGHIMGVLEDMGNWVVNTGEDVVNWTVGGLKGTAEIVMDVVEDITDLYEDITGDIQRIIEGTYCFDDDDLACALDNSLRNNNNCPFNSPGCY